MHLFGHFWAKSIVRSTGTVWNTVPIGSETNGHVTIFRSRLSLLTDPHIQEVGSQWSLSTHLTLQSNFKANTGEPLIGLSIAQTVLPGICEAIVFLLTYTRWSSLQNGETDKFDFRLLNRERFSLLLFESLCLEDLKLQADAKVDMSNTVAVDFLKKNTLTSSGVQHCLQQRTG